MDFFSFQTRCTYMQQLNYWTLNETGIFFLSNVVIIGSMYFIKLFRLFFFFHLLFTQNLRLRFALSIGKIQSSKSIEVKNHSEEFQFCITKKIWRKKKHQKITFIFAFRKYSMIFVSTLPTIISWNSSLSSVKQCVCEHWINVRSHKNHYK